MPKKHQPQCAETSEEMTDRLAQAAQKAEKPINLLTGVLCAKSFSGNSITEFAQKINPACGAENSARAHTNLAATLPKA